LNVPELTQPLTMSPTARTARTMLRMLFMFIPSLYLQ
jgi:hypothetical protein